VGILTICRHNEAEVVNTSVRLGLVLSQNGMAPLRDSAHKDINTAFPLSSLTTISPSSRIASSIIYIVSIMSALVRLLIQYRQAIHRICTPNPSSILRTAQYEPRRSPRLPHSLELGLTSHPHYFLAMDTVVRGHSCSMHELVWGGRAMTTVRIHDR
jgi:hypothetical protein